MHLEHVPAARVHLKGRLDARPLEARMEALRIPEQHFVGPDLDEHRRQPLQVGEHG